MVYHVSIHCFKRIGLHSHMIKGGGAGKNLNNISYLSRIHFGGHIKNMMASYGI